MSQPSKRPRRFSLESALPLFLVFVPVAVVLHFLHANPIAVFAASSLAIVPLAGLMGKATEHLAEHLGEGWGGLLNATFGNAAELIIALFALRAGLHEVVKASITGSIIGNILLVLGLAVLAGGLRYPVLRYNPTAAQLSTTLLFLSAIGLLVPAVYHGLSGPAAHEQELSLEISVVLFLTYLLSLVFSLRTHRHLYLGETEHAAPEEKTAVWSSRRSGAVLVGATALIAWMSELLVEAIEPTAAALGMTEVFVGVILVAIIGNAAEHSTAILVAVKNKMDLAINIAVGSSLQIALFVAPLLVFASYAFGKPMNLHFSTFEVLAVVVSVFAVRFIGADGESNWMEGVQLLAVYLILGLAFYFLPA
jgi:Ca2+:H+ antiporter